MSEEIVRCIFTDDDVRGIAADNNIDPDAAIAVAREWGKHIADTLCGIASEQLESVILTGHP